MPETRSNTESLAALNQRVAELSQMVRQLLKNQEEKKAKQARMDGILEQIQTSLDELLPASARAGKQSVLESDDPPLLATPPEFVSHGFSDQPLRIHNVGSPEQNTGVLSRVPREEVPILHDEVVVDRTIPMERYLEHNHVTPYSIIDEPYMYARVHSISICSPSVCLNASMGCSSYFIMCASTDSYILVPAAKVDDLSVLLRNMNDSYKMESSLLCWLQPWKGIKVVQRCRYVKFIDGNYVYDKGKSDMYDNEWYGAVVEEKLMGSSFTGDTETYILKGSFGIQEWTEEYRALMIEIIVELDDVGMESCLEGAESGICYLLSPLEWPRMEEIDPNSPCIIIGRVADDKPFVEIAFKFMCDVLVGSLIFVRGFARKLTTWSYAIYSIKGNKERVGHSSYLCKNNL